jgi:nitrite reductase/ring-hydroxylating ferredoxin subunit
MGTRREFLADACRLCAVITTAGFATTFLEGCNSLQVVTATVADNTLKVPLTAFTEKSQILVRSKKTAYDIFVNKKSAGDYTALLMECTHEQQPLTASGSALFCASHGSKFDLEGNVLLAPATKKLVRYPVTANDTELTIELKPI